uniref:TRAF1-6 MATH domain-containing protein n=1 Tax=Amphimedon queenslandica TaxID=400682 RepID=A0A1X7TUV4_AMPQE
MKLKAQNSTYFTPGFYTSPGGYKMKLKVDCNGCDIARGTHIYCHVFLMEEHNDTIEWPFQGKVTITLLNQLDENHRKFTISFNADVFFYVTHICKKFKQTLIYI